MIDNDTLYVLTFFKEKVKEKAFFKESKGKGSEKRTREVTRRYKFVVDGKSVRVCKKFFMATLGVDIDTGLCFAEETGY